MYELIEIIEVNEKDNWKDDWPAKIVMLLRFSFSKMEP